MQTHNVLKKVFSLFLSFIFIILSVPLVLAAETLTEANVQTWPTLSYKHPNGAMYYPMSVSEGLTINDDEVVLDAEGNQVAGHFEFVNPDKVPAGSTNVKADLLFVPDDTNAYSTIKKNRSPVTFNIQSVQLVFVDENNPPVAASKIVKGATLSTVKISGGQVKNPYVDTDSHPNDAYWSWVNPDTIVNESGEYEAKLMGAGNYEPMTRMVYVEVDSGVEATQIVESPTATISYGQSWADVKFEGGKVMAGDVEVSGTFSCKSTGKPSSVGVYSAVQVIFTPNDLEKYTTCEGVATVTVTKGSYELVDENGEVVVPEITMPYGTTFISNLSNGALGVAINSYIKDYSSMSYVDKPRITFVGYETGDVIPVGTNTYTVRLSPNNSGQSNYNATEADIILTIEPVVITTTAYWSRDGIISGRASHKVNGSFDVYVDGKLVGDDVKIVGANNEWTVEYPIPATGDYTIKVVYNRVENDPYMMDDFETVVTAKIKRSLTYFSSSNSTSVSIKVNGNNRGIDSAVLGDTVELSTLGGELFRGWKITDKNGSIVDLGIADLMANEITFTMPDCDLIIEAQYQQENVGGDDDGGFDIDDLFGGLFEGNSDSWFINLISNIVASVRSIITKISDFFRQIGNRT